MNDNGTRQTDINLSQDNTSSEISDNPIYTSQIKEGFKPHEIPSGGPLKKMWCVRKEVWTLISPQNMEDVNKELLCFKD